MGRTFLRCRPWKAASPLTIRRLDNPPSTRSWRVGSQCGILGPTAPTPPESWGPWCLEGAGPGLRRETWPAPQPSLLTCPPPHPHKQPPFQRQTPGRGPAGPGAGAGGRRIPELQRPGVGSGEGVGVSSASPALGTGWLQPQQGPRRAGPDPSCPQGRTGVATTHDKPQIHQKPLVFVYFSINKIFCMSGQK